MCARAFGSGPPIPVLLRERTMKRRNAVSQTGLALVVGLLITVLSAPAWSQGFMVKPMKMEFSPRLGQTVGRVLELRNTGTDEAKTLELRLVELTQKSDGSWKIIEPGSGVDTSKLPSCLKWVKLSAETVNVKPLEMAPVTVSVKVPRGARGYYTAGMLAKIRPKPGVTGVAIVVRFLIPILVDIQGRPVRQKIALTDVGMEFREKSEKTPATTLVSMGIANSGRGYSRIKGSARVMRFSKGHWRRVATTEYRELGILPGVTLNLKSDLERRLPSGKYKLTGTLYVDGRRIRPLEKELDFVGDPSVTKVAVDTALVLEPPELSITAVPGATRTAVIKVENASDDAVKIEATAAIPPPLGGVAFGDLKGEDLSCAPWVRVSPSKFTLRAGGRQNVRVIARMPKAKKMYANYYGLLALRASYPDGQSAGKTTTLVCVRNARIEPKPAAQAMNVALAGEEASKYVVRARFANTGNVHFTPKCRAVVATGIGQSVTEAVLSGEAGLMLPLEVRNFSGIIDLAGLEPGAYALKAVLEYAPGRGAARQIPIRVSVEEGQKVVTIIEAKQEKPETKPSPAKLDQPKGKE